MSKDKKNTPKKKPKEVGLRHLRYAGAVIRLKNYQKAADECGVTQPTVTDTVNELEKQLLGDVPLFNHRTFELTPAGKFFERQAREVLRLTKKLVEDVKAVAKGKRESIRVGFAESPTQRFRSQSFEAFKKETGMVVIKRDFTSVQMLNGLLDGDLDVALTVPLPPEMMGRLLTCELDRFPVCVAVKGGKSKFSSKRTLSLQDLRGLPFIGFSKADYPEYHMWAVPVLQQIGAHMEQECDTEASLATAVAAGDGVALIASCFADKISHDIRVIRLTPTPTTVAVVAAWYADVEVANKFVNIAKQVTAKIGRRDQC